jgi:heme-degrading monooxygenase HmoA
MIIRVFRPTVHPGSQREFEAFLREEAVPLVSRQAGLVAQHVGRPRDPSSTEYVYVTVWEDVESIRAFAGERWQEAVTTPDEAHLLQDTWIGHYELLAAGRAREPDRLEPSPGPSGRR